jgi:hypothetical protein
MRRISRIFATMLVCTLLGVPVFSGYADLVVDNKAKKFREERGFLTTPAQIDKAKLDSKSNTSEQLYGFELTDEEAYEFILRSLESKESGALVRNLAKNKVITNFAGSYMNPKTGKLQVGIVNLDEKTKKIILDAVPHKDRIEFFNAKFAKEELDAQMDLLNSKVEELQKQGLVFNSFGVSEISNIIEVNLPNDLRNKVFFTNLVDEKYLSFKVTESIKPLVSTKIRFDQVGQQLQMK